MQAARKQQIIEAGAAGEAATNAWLKAQRLSYVAVCQAPDTFSPLFSTSVKRPDFLLLFESVGMIAVDVKNYSQKGGVYTLKLEEELKRSIAFERLFRIPLWYAYYENRAGNDCWYWISALKAIEVGEERENSATKEKFLAIKVSDFEEVRTAADLAKLYTHRLPGVDKIGAMP